MRRGVLIVLLVVSVLSVALCGSLGAVRLSQGRWGYAAWNLTVTAIHVWLVGHYYRRLKAHGSNRRTEADPPDTGPGSFTYKITASGADPKAIAAALSTYATRAGLRSGGIIPPSYSSTRQPVGVVELVESDMPILAHRVAGLCLDGHPSKPFESLTNRGRFGVDDDAQCRPLYGYAMGGHDAPDLACSCGFYALPSDVTPWEEGQNHVTLLVELTGTVIEHTHGYRAGHQRVIECQMPPCPLCNRPGVFGFFGDFRLQGVTCAEHAAAAVGVKVTAADIERVVTCPVTWQGVA